MDAPEVVIVGAGPAGMSAGLWCATLGLRTLVVEARAREGGQLYEVPVPMENVPGQPGVTGAALAETLRAQCLAAGVVLRCDATVALAHDRLRASVADVGINPTAVILATGVRRRQLGVPGEREFVGRGVAYNLGHDPSRYAGLRAVIVGGGDDAFEHARLLAPHCASVTLVHRGERFAARNALRAPILADTRVTRITSAALTAVEGGTRVERVRVRQGDVIDHVATDVVFVCVGPQPMSEGFHVACDARGYVRVDRLQRTSRAGVYAVGDVCSPEAPTVATAFGQGAIAAKQIERDARGEGRPRVDGDDELTVAGLSLPARIGVYPRERQRMQTLTFDIGFVVDAAAASPDDALGGTIDYAAVASEVEAMLAAQHYNLIETVADRLAARLLVRFGLRRVRVRVTKPGVPQRHAAASVEVRRRAD